MSANPASAEPRQGRLLAAAGVTFGVAVTVGNAVGVGILRSPSQIAAEMPGVWAYLAVWLAAGGYAFLVANAYSELATRATGAAGGQYVWIREAFGDAPAFVVGCLDWLATCGVLAVAATVLGDYAVGLFPELRAPEVIALGAILLVVLVQWCGVHVSVWFQNVSSLMKVAALLLFVVLCLYFGTRDVTSAAVIADREGSMIFAIFLALEAAVFTYHGTAAATYFGSEYRDARRTIPRALFTGVAIVLGLYLIVNLGILRVVPLATIAGRGAATDVVAERLFGADGAIPARALVTVALLSAISSAALIAPRILYAMSLDRLFWHGARDVNRRGTPEMGLMLSCGLAAALAITRTFDTIVIAVAVIFVANAAASFAALFRLRTAAATTRSYRAWGHPFTTALGFVASIGFLLLSLVVDRHAALNTLGLAAVSLLLFALARIRRPVLT